MSIHRAKKKTVAKTNIQQLFDDRNGGQIALRGYSYGGAIQIQQIVVTSTLKAKAVQDLTGVLMAILS